MPVSKSQIKFVTSLSIKKFRDESGFFVAEGTKTVNDLSRTFVCNLVFATYEWLQEHIAPECKNLIQVTDDELKKLSQQKNPQGVIAVFKKRETVDDFKIHEKELSLFLDGIQDPGNLGTIIRLADWFGIKNVYCSLHSADAYSHKTLQATMGALARVNVHYVTMNDFFCRIPSGLPVYGTFMEGNNIYAEQLTQSGIIVLGNEGNGISPEVEKMITKKLMIPEFSNGEKSSESLNVAIAGAIVCSEFRRRNLSSTFSKERKSV